MKLYHSPKAPNPDRVVFFLRAKGKLDGSKHKVNSRFGWDQAAMEKDMSLRYDQIDLEGRLDDAVMTSEM